MDDIMVALDVSKGSVSNGARQLIAFGAIRQVWMPGDPRRDHYESVGDLHSVIEKIYSEFIQPRVGAGGRAVSKLLDDLDEDRSRGRLDRSDAEFCRERLESLLEMQKRFEQLVPLAEKLLL
jgi:DNA-binding transcriptional regulator GbsR (MarR family)